MKTTIDIPESLLQRAKAFAKSKKTSLREVACEGIERILTQQQESVKPYTFKGTLVQGKGLQTEFQNANWSKIRNAAYGDRE